MWYYVSAWFYVVNRVLELCLVFFELGWYAVIAADQDLSTESLITFYVILALQTPCIAALMWSQYKSGLAQLGLSARIWRNHFTRESEGGSVIECGSSGDPPRAKDAKTGQIELEIKNPFFSQQVPDAVLNDAPSTTPLHVISVGGCSMASDSDDDEDDDQRYAPSNKQTLRRASLGASDVAQITATIRESHIARRRRGMRRGSVPW